MVHFELARLLGSRLLGGLNIRTTTSRRKRAILDRMSMKSADPNVAAYHAVNGTTNGKHEAPQLAVQAAWEAWAGHLQRVDERTKTLLRAAFEAGYEAGASANSPAEMGRRGGKKGGTARAAALSKRARTMIAKKAANARWHRKDG